MRHTFRLTIAPSGASVRELLGMAAIVHFGLAVSGARCQTVIRLDAMCSRFAMP